MNQAPNIPDHEMICCAGRGSYGEVWLAKSVMGTFRGIKIVYRQTFDHDRPFEREFQGIQKFEPVSRTHPGLVSILQVGRNMDAGYFYYVMEVADDLVSGTAINPQNYTPKNLSNTLSQLGKFTLPACLEIGLALAAALAHLHRQGLIHRDIKPSNIIFVNGVPKFADIGLVTKIGEATTFVGTQGYIAPEGPGSPAADIYSLGKVLYELSMGKNQNHFPELPTQVDEPTSIPEFLHWNQIIMRACETNVNQRFQSADELHAALSTLGSPASVVGQASRLPTGRVAPETQGSGMTAPPAGGTPAPLFQAPRTPTAASPHSATLQPSSSNVLNSASKAMRVAILYKSNVQPDGRLLELLSTRLSQLNCHVFFDKHLAIGVEWAREIEKKIRDSDAAIVLLSASSIQSEMIAYEVEIAHQAAQQQSGKPRLLPVRIQYRGPLPGPLAPLLDALQYFLWEGPNDDDRLVQELLRAIDTSQKPTAPQTQVKLESIGGAVPLDSQYYVQRPTDQEFQAAIARRDSIVLVKGARQMGKTSLLARGLQQARQAGAKVVLTDFQKLNASHLASVDAFFRVLGDFLSDQLDLSVLPQDVWDPAAQPEH